MSKHTPGYPTSTPGPWVIHHSEPRTFVYALNDATPRYNRMWMHVQGSSATPIDELEANASLIAAAPELLAVAKLLVDANCDEAVAFATQRAHAAIAKATGGAE